MKRLPWILGACGLALAAMLIWKRPESPAAPALSSEPHSASTSAGPSSRPAPAATGPAEASAPPAAVQEDVEAVLAEIEEASVTYDAAALPRIEPHLLHTDAAVRSAAVDGMLVLGESAAAPLLREAAKRQADPREAVKMIEAAEYLELPRGSLLSSDRRKYPREPLPGKPEPGGNRKPAVPEERPEVR